MNYSKSLKNIFFQNNNIILEGKLNNKFDIMQEKASSLKKLYKKEKLENKSLTKWYKILIFNSYF